MIHTAKIIHLKIKSNKKALQLRKASTQNYFSVIKPELHPS